MQKFIIFSIVIFFVNSSLIFSKLIEKSVSSDSRVFIKYKQLLTIDNTSSFLLKTISSFFTFEIRSSLISVKLK